MIELIKSKLVKTRKEHRCFGCFSRIPAGSKNILCQTFVEDVIYTLYFCKSCNKHIDEHCQKCQLCYVDDEGTNEGFVTMCEKEDSND